MNAASHPSNNDFSSHPSAVPGKHDLPRETVQVILQAALSAGEVRFAQQISLAWLTAYPGDLPVRLWHAQSLLRSGSKKNTGIPQAIPLLESLCQVDPEFLEAHLMLRTARRFAGLPANPVLEGNIMILGGRGDAKCLLPPWAPLLLQARQTLNMAKSAGAGVAEQLVHKALTTQPESPLAGIMHIQMAEKADLPQNSIHSLVEMYHDRWPECLHFTLLLADSLMDGGEADRAVGLLHQAAAQDVTSQVPSRIWKTEHPYQGLWPERLAAPVLQDISIPAAVAAALGWNRLPANLETITPRTISKPDYAVSSSKAPEAEEAPDSLPPFSPDAVPGSSENVGLKQNYLSEEEWLASFAQELNSNEPAPTLAPRPTPSRSSGTAKLPSIRLDVPNLPEDLRHVQAELEKVAVQIKKPQLAHADGRFPAYIVFSTRRGLQSQYGVEGADQVIQAMRALVEAVRGRAQWNSLLYLADDPLGSEPTLTKLQLKPAKPGDPWSLKLALTDIDAALRKQGEMIGALLIVGGPEVVPFHRLPNPVDDDDVDVPSDNPYASRDENYFIPEWPIGRLPGGSGKDPYLLVKCLKRYAEKHREMAKKKRWPEQLVLWTVERVLPLLTRTKPGLGYSAAIWKRASASVFRPIGEPAFMLISPPVQVSPGTNGHSQPTGEGNKDINGNSDRKSLLLPAARMGYFNLHGMADAAEWYGHNDPFEPDEGPDYPIALRPNDISRPRQNGRPLEVVFSEACFGAHLEGRCVDESIALTFLSSGVQAIVGSTCTAYGAVSLPLTAADMLGYAFWSGITAGLPSGEALRRAKLRLAREMHRRQGYLDGEDQKTLVSFVLYGDPLSQPIWNGRKAKSILRSDKPPSSVKLVCDLNEPGTPVQSIQPEMLEFVKNIVRDYLPGMEGAQLSLSQEHLGCDQNGHKCPSAQMGTGSEPSSPPMRKVVTLSKHVPNSQYIHKHYARLTLDAKGKLVKLVVSR